VVGAPPDSVVGELTGELTGTLADSAAEARVPQIVAELAPPSEGASWTTYEWDRDAILRSNAMTLLDLLAELAPGFTTVRGSWFGGPHQAIQGALGPGFVSVSLDGRELTSLDAGQIDFSRIALAGVEKVRVRRRADGWVAEVTTLRRQKRDAYSRITGGTGDPDLSRLRMIFSNGVGRSFNVGASIDLLEAGGDHPSNDFNFSGRLEWLPGGGDAGLELHWMSENVERTLYSPLEFDRKELFLRGRGNLGDQLQAEAFVGNTGLSEDGESIRSYTHGGFRLSGESDRGWFRSSIGLWDDPVQAVLDGGLEAGFGLLPWLSVNAGARYGSWAEFSTYEGRAGLSARFSPLGLTLAAEGATGRRGVSYPALERADSVSFDVAAAELSLKAGPFTLSGRGEYQNLGRQLPFGAEFDRDAEAGSAIELGIAEGGIHGPVIPLNLLFKGVAPVAVRGFWRYATVLEGDRALYVPTNVARGEVFWNDTFFDGELEFMAGFGLNYRDEMLTASAPGSQSGSVAEVPGYTYFDWNLMIRILSVRVYWRFDNLTAAEGQDLPLLEFPPLRSVFGVKWEFLN
jgi:hypothetical protein